MSSLDVAQEAERRGDLRAAVAAYAECGALKEAARIAWKLGDLHAAAEFSSRGGHSYETALCFLELRDISQALHYFVRTPPEHPQYRDAVRRAIAAAAATHQMDMRLDRFLAPWLDSAPRSDDEVEILLQLANLYEMHAMNDNANAVLTKAFVARPKDPAIARRLSRTAVGPTSVPATDVQEEMGFRRAMWRGSDDEGASTEGALLEPGTTIAERWVLEDVIGRGGMAVVFRARDLELGQPVAIKVFTQLVRNKDAEMRFKREVSLSRSLTHRNIIRVFDIGRVHGHQFITMELLVGHDLDTYLVPGVPFDIDAGVRYLMQACAGLHHAHERGIVHRDIKPANFFIDDTGVLKVMDFGIARQTDQQEREKVTETGMILGTPEYISPEQITDFANTGPSTDLYALGVILFQLLTGRVPFDGDKPVDVLMAHIHQDPPRPRSFNPAISTSLEAITLRLLQKQPQHRFASAKEIAIQLKAALTSG